MKGIEILTQAAVKFNGMDLGDFKFDIPLDKDLPMYGLRSPLDSLSFTAFVMAVEEQIEGITHKYYNLTTQDIMDRAFTVFGNIGSFAAFLDGLNGNQIQKDC